MPRAAVTILLALGAFVCSLDAQSRSAGKAPPPKSSPTPPPVREQPLMQCPSILGNGLTTQRLYCDVLTGTDPAGGLRITLPRRKGPVRLFMTLHNRQTYSESDVKAGRAFVRYTAALRLVSPSGDKLAALAVRSEFRSARDLVERIGGGAGPGGVKAVAPTGAESVVLEVPDGLSEVALLGENLTVERLGGTEVVAAPGRQIAVVSQVEIEYRPATTSAARPARR